MDEGTLRQLNWENVEKPIGDAKEKKEGNAACSDVRTSQFSSESSDDYDDQDEDDWLGNESDLVKLLESGSANRK